MAMWIRYLRLAMEVGRWSKCLSRQLGALVVTRDGTVIGTGYNGPPRGVPHCDSREFLEFLSKIRRKEGVDFNPAVGGKVCPRRLMGFPSGQGMQYCPAAHAERNALINSAREGIRVSGCVLVAATPVPCFECSKEIVNAGISMVVSLDEQYDEMGPWLLGEGGVDLIRVDKNLL